MDFVMFLSQLSVVRYFINFELNKTTRIFIIKEFRIRLYSNNIPALIYVLLKNDIRYPFVVPIVI
jgi:hypothetical protein